MRFRYRTPDVNTGTIEATGGGQLILDNSLNLNNSGGLILANGGNVLINNATISGGTLTAVSPSVVNLGGYGTATLDGVTISGGTFTVNNIVAVTSSAMTNNGTILIGGLIGGYPNNSNSILFKGTVLSGSGNITLNGYLSSAQLNGNLTQAASHTIQGYGEVAASITNYGLVNANVSGQALYLLSANMVNFACFQAANGGTLFVDFTNISQSANGQISAVGTPGTASFVTLQSSSVSGGLLNSSGGGLFLVQGTTTIDFLTNNATIDVPAGQSVKVTGDIVNNGTFLVNSNQAGTASTVTFSSVTLSGAGNITLSAAGANAQINGSLTQSAGHTIQGEGQINAALVNNGTVLANVNGQTLSVNGATTNSGMFRASNGGILQVAGGALGNLSGNSLTGGTYEVDANSAINLLPVPGVSVTTNTAAIILNGTPTAFSAIAPLAVNAGSFTLQNGATFSTTSNLTSAGTVSVGSTGSLTVNGSYIQSAGSTVVNGQLNVTGQTAINGGTFQLDAPGLYSSAIVDNASLSIQGGTSIAPVITGKITGSGSLTVGSAPSGTGYLQLGASSGTTAISALTINPGSSLDITNNNLAINYGALPNPVSTIRGYLKSAYNGGLWTGPGLTSSVVAAQVAATIAAQTGGVYGIGYVDGGTDKNQSANAVITAVGNQIVYTPALIGDANLDGSVTFIDLGIVAQNLGAINSDWQHGDFNYDGTTNFLDIGLLAQNLNKTVLNTPLDEIIPDPSAALTAQWNLAVAELQANQTQLADLPEPGMIGLLALGAGGLLARRRNRK